MLSLLAPVLVAVFLLAIQGVLLRISCAICAYDDPPPYSSALWTALVAAILAVVATAAWSCTFGLLASLIVGKTISTLLGGLVGLVVTAEVYRRRLATSSGHALVITGVHHGLAWGLSAVVLGVLRLVVG